MRGFPNVVCFLMLTLAAFEPALADSNAASRRPRIVMIAAPKDFTDREYADPRAVFDARGASVRVASTSRETAVSHTMVKVPVDQPVRELTPEQFDALVIVGGTGALTYLLDDEALRNVIVAACRSNKVVAGICVAPAVLARAGVLRNRQATCYPDKRVIAMLKMNGADYTAQRIVTSSRIVTANGPEAAKDFALRVLDALAR